MDLQKEMVTAAQFAHAELASSEVSHEQAKPTI